jgi:hypothetical protein
MSNYANSEERRQLIAGLRGLADYLDQNPDVPAPRFGTSVHVFPCADTDAEARTEIDVIASRIGVRAAETSGGHYVGSRCFGPVEYRAVAIPRDSTSTSTDEE